MHTKIHVLLVRIFGDRKQDSTFCLCFSDVSVTILRQPSPSKWEILMVMYSLYFHFKRHYNVMLKIKIKGNNSIELHAIKSTGLHDREEEFFGIWYRHVPKTTLFTNRIWYNIIICPSIYFYLLLSLFM